MLPWFLRDSERLTKERAGVDELARSTSWLVGVDWGIAGELNLDAIIRAHDHDYGVRLSFPDLFPDAPIVVRPRNMQGRISTHQYGGAEGALCLEWGPDNWHRDITAVQMLQSAHRLFETENPLGENRPAIPVVAQSRHALTIGQEIRGKWARWYASPSLLDYTTAQPTGTAGNLQFSLRDVGDDWIVFVHELTPQGGSSWKETLIPSALPGAVASDLLLGAWLKTELASETIDSQKNLADLQAILPELTEKNLLTTGNTSGVLVMDGAGMLHFFIVLPSAKTIACKRLESERTPMEIRAPNYPSLNTKSIAIVGLGSVGSKLATTLARMGVGKFYLVDHDILLPENLSRHALDWTVVGEHKVNAATIAINRINPEIKTEVSRLHLTGQESNASVNGVLNKLAECDLIIDATANSKVFNLLAAAARTSKRPMIWMEVFGGGTGGMVARSRPSLDPIPQDMRGAYLQYCTDNPAPTTSQTNNSYTTETADGEVLTASDSDVAIIAHHAARFVPDCFTPPEQAKFPYSMYLIGLTKAWVFDAPFATIPISMESFSTAGWEPEKTTEYSQDNVQFIVGLIEKQKNAIANPTGNQNPTG